MTEDPSGRTAGVRSATTLAGGITLLCLIASLMLVPAGAGAARPEAQLRFVHAVPGVGTAELSVDGVAVGSAGFGDATAFAAVPAGERRASLAVPGGGRLESKLDLVAGRAYTVVAMPKGDAAVLRSYADGRPAGGEVRLRVIHAAAELGSPMAKLDGQVVAHRLDFGRATKYLSFDAGNHQLALDDPATGVPAVASQKLSVGAGTSWTAVLVGGGGERARTVLLSDSVAAPAGAPQTGFGGLAPGGDRPWSLALLAALVAGTAGATLRMLRLRRR